MKKAISRNFEILDCTIRDGGYINNWEFDMKLVREIYRVLSKSGVHYIEIGYRGTEKYFNPKEFGRWRFSREKDIREAVGGIAGAKLAVMADFGKVDLQDFPNSKESIVELVRLAVNKDQLKGAVSFLDKLKDKGYKVSLNLMGYSNYSITQQNRMIKMLKGSDIDYLYVVDSYGSLFPSQIRPLFKPLMESLRMKIGFHPHNSLQMALANTLEAIRCGVHIVDSTIYGMGRAAGNLPTEIILSILEKEGKDRYNSIPVLDAIDRYFIPLQKDSKWGYQLPYMISGLFACHPNYAKALVDAHEYTMEDIWKAMDYIKGKSPIGFSKTILQDLIKDGIISSIDKIYRRKVRKSSKKTFDKKKAFSVKVPYIDRHKNRDFLVLANGPSLKKYKAKISCFIAKYNPVILGANYLGGLFVPDYHVFNNKRRFIDYIDTVKPESRLLIGQYITEEMIREYTDSDYERIYYSDTLNYNFGINNGLINTNCRTVAVLLLGVAIVMGARRIFSVGMDGYLQEDQKPQSAAFHFYAEKDEKEDREMILERHYSCQKFIEQIDSYLSRKGKEGIHILTPTSYKAFYKGIENYI